MKKTPILKRASIFVALSLAGCFTSLALVPLFQSQAINASLKSGGQGSDCPGPYIASTTLTNSAGAVWITPPAGATNGTLTDISPYPAPYASVASVMRRSDGMTWCAGDSVSFPVSSGNVFQLKIYVVSGPFTNGQPVTAQIAWQ
jgi:hypothetical protein